MSFDSAATTLGAAIVGLGVGEQHAMAYARLPQCRLVYVCDLDQERARAVAARFADVRIAQDYSAIIADPSVDVVSIASYDDAHGEQVAAALAGGKHVFVEKPLCRSMAELRVIKDHWLRANDRYLASNLVLRAAPLYRWLRDAIAAGELGDVYAFDGDYLYGRLHKITDGWRRDVEDYSVIQGGGVHLVDLMLWVTGQRPATVTAAGNGISTAGSAFRHNDFIAATYLFPSGLIGRITANFGSVHRHQHVVRVFGTKGTFIVDDAGARLHTSRDPAASVVPLSQWSPLPATKGDLIPEFVAGIVDGRDADRRASTQHEYDVMSACFAADAAALTGASCPVDYL